MDPKRYVSAIPTTTGSGVTVHIPASMLTLEGDLVVERTPMGSKPTRDDVRLRFRRREDVPDWELER